MRNQLATDVQTHTWNEPADMKQSTASTPQETTETGVEKQSSTFLELFRKYASLSDLLRYGGALSVAIAMALFLMEGAVALTDIQRFLTMLGFTGALSVAGFLMSVLLKEQRSSRVFVALALLSVPVNFTVFGALLYSFMPLDGIAADYPGFATWQAASMSSIALAIGAGLSVLLPVVWAGYTVLARTERRWLSAALLLSSAALIIPVRHEVIIGIVAVLAAGASWWLLRRYGKESLALKTVEGKFAITLLFISPVVMIARSMFLYEASGVLLLMLSGGIYFAARQLLNNRSQASWFTAAVTLFASILSYGIAASVFAIVEPLIADEYAIVFAACVFLVINADLVRVSLNKRLAGTLGIFAVVLVACLLVALALFEGGSILVLICVAALVIIAAAGYLLRYPSSSVIAATGLAAISVTYIENLWTAAMATGWWGIAALGVIAIVAGSLIDRVGTVVVQKAEAVEA